MPTVYSGMVPLGTRLRREEGDLLSQNDQYSIDDFVVFQLTYSALETERGLLQTFTRKQFPNLDQAAMGTCSKAEVRAGSGEPHNRVYDAIMKELVKEISALYVRNQYPIVVP
ncbi:hypothetical protein FRC17_008417 [Serendipita sp. 399]|nr:hypothetical protein FRC17_008417 [Serendipita sp. 399]